MNIAHRDLLEKISGGNSPMSRAVAAALYEIDRLRAENRDLKALNGSFRQPERNMVREQEGEPCP